MLKNTIHFGEQFQDLTTELTNHSVRDVEFFYEAYGELFNHYQLLSEAVEQLSENETSSVNSIASYFLDFHLNKFQAMNHSFILENPNDFSGGILYANQDILFVE